ncbi:hypothetical protein C8F04DRAFT_1337893 [Mycena alexandri]|uniref:Uncharacterized protein n=1 Tax=Mycena alexandri TaxID=1745969 RepID=A0AAD6RXN5_9AGAR|nr:hypothetical protein C8F04DRAFT_1337893 [Mycena alexandri]
MYKHQSFLPNSAGRKTNIEARQLRIFSAASLVLCFLHYHPLHSVAGVWSPPTFHWGSWSGCLRFRVSSPGPHTAPGRSWPSARLHLIEERVIGTNRLHLSTYYPTNYLLGQCGGYPHQAPTLRRHCAGKVVAFRPPSFMQYTGIQGLMAAILVLSRRRAMHKAVTHICFPYLLLSRREKNTVKTKKIETINHAIYAHEQDSLADRLQLAIDAVGCQNKLPFKVVSKDLRATNFTVTWSITRTDFKKMQLANTDHFDEMVEEAVKKGSPTIVLGGLVLARFGSVRVQAPFLRTPNSNAAFEFRHFPNPAPEPAFRFRSAFERVRMRTKFRHLGGAKTWSEEHL